MQFFLDCFPAAQEQVAIDAAGDVQPRIGRAYYCVGRFIEKVAELNDEFDDQGSFTSRPSASQYWKTRCSGPACSSLTTSTVIWPSSSNRASSCRLRLLR